MSKPNNGGPAFPAQQGHCPDGTWNQSFEWGMSVRQYYKAKAVIGILSDERYAQAGNEAANVYEIARYAGRLADALIAEDAAMSAEQEGGKPAARPEDRLERGYREEFGVHLDHKPAAPDVAALARAPLPASLPFVEKELYPLIDSALTSVGLLHDEGLKSALCGFFYTPGAWLIDQYCASALSALVSERDAARTELGREKMHGEACAKEINLFRADLTACREREGKLREALKPIMEMKAENCDGQIGWRSQPDAKAGWVLVSHILAAEKALEGTTVAEDARTYIDHKHEERRNAGVINRPQGPCDCEACKRHRSALLTPPPAGTEEKG